MDSGKKLQTLQPDRIRLDDMAENGSERQLLDASSKLSDQKITQRSPIGFKKSLS